MVIKMKQPSLVLHAHDVPGYRYEMWKSWEMPKGSSVSDMIYWIRWAASHSETMGLKNAIINCHGSPGYLHIGGSGDGGNGFGVGSASLFNILQNYDLGTIWIVACQAAKDHGGTEKGKIFCSAIARAAGCRVIAAEKNQRVNFLYNFHHPYGSIDDYEGTVYEFSPDGSHKVWTKKSDN